MENKNTEIASQFPATYPLPENQAEYEKQLIKSFRSDFPEASWMLDSNLGYLEQHTHTKGSAALALRVPGPTEAEGSAPYIIKGVGELPLETVAMLGGLYALTGAEISNEDTTENVHQVIRKGQYRGKPIYFTERHATYGDSEPTCEISVTHEDNVLSPQALFAKRHPMLGELLDRYDPIDKPDSEWPSR